MIATILTIIKKYIINIPVIIKCNHIHFLFFFFFVARGLNLNSEFKVERARH